MSVNSKEDFLYITGILIIVIPLLYEILKRRRKANPLYVAFIIVNGAILLFLGIDKIHRDKKALTALNADFKEILRRSKSDSSDNAIFLKRLEKFNIKKDSTTNEPKIISNTFNIDKVEKMEFNQ